MLSRKDFLMDKRLAERFIKRGQLSRDDHKKYLNSLADVADKAEPLSPEEPERAPTEDPES